MGSRDYDVFARSEPGRPLRQVGTVSAASIDDAAVFAHSLYDERTWKEMLVVPREELVRVITPP
jgi:1,2-phenylacetyl-CoA epoxidase PaaB subunit